MRTFCRAILIGLLAAPVAVAVSQPPGVDFEPPAAEQREAAIDRGVQFLLERQNPNGSWGSIGGQRPFEVLAPVPGAHHAFRAAVTSLCVSALLETRAGETGVQEAIDRAEAWMFEHLPRLRRATPAVFYNTWGHAYAIRALVRLREHRQGDPAGQQRLREMIEEQIELLCRYEVVDGGWAYYDFEARTQRPSGSSIGFVSATVLIALDEARAVGIETPERYLRRAQASILRQRNPDFSYVYGEYLKYRPMLNVNRPAGSLGRSQVCNLAMRRWGDETVTDDVIRQWLDRLFARNGWLDIGRKRPIPHESWFQVAGYFFYYGHFYAAGCIELLPEAERRPYQDRMTALLIGLQEQDGSWWDFPLYDYHQQYGTAYALMTLHRCR